MTRPLPGVEGCTKANRFLTRPGTGGIWTAARAAASPGMLEADCRNAGVDTPRSVEEAGINKPHPIVCHLAVDR